MRFSTAKRAGRQRSTLTRCRRLVDVTVDSRIASRGLKPRIPPGTCYGALSVAYFGFQKAVPRVAQIGDRGRRLELQCLISLNEISWDRGRVAVSERPTIGSELAADDIHGLAVLRPSGNL